MRTFRRGLKRTVASCLAVSMVATMCVPVGAAYGIGSLQTWEAPKAKTATTVVKDGKTYSYITSSAHKVTESTADLLGISNITVFPNAGNPYAFNRSADENYYGYDNAGSHVVGISETARFGLFGSDVNQNPNPWYANYFYNAYQMTSAVQGTDLASDRDTLLISTTASGGPMAADSKVVDAYGTSSALYYRPDILYGTGEITKDGSTVFCGDSLSSTCGYTALVNKIRNKELGSYEGVDLYQTGDENYNPWYAQYTTDGLGNSVTNLYSLATAAEDIIERTANTSNPKTTRYEDPMEIAENYEAFQRGTQYAVLNAIDKGQTKRKTIAIVTAVDTETNTITLAKSAASSAKSGGNILADGLENVTDNLLDVINSADGTCTAADIMKCDAVYINGYMGMAGSSDSGTSAMKDKLVTVLKAGGYADEAKYPGICTQGPKTAIHVQAASPECTVYMAANVGFAYPEVINPVYALAYYYENFVHVKSSRLADAMGLNMASMSLPSGVTLDLSNYNAADYEKILKTGLSYYKANKEAIDAAYPKLVATDNLVLPTDISKATVTVAACTYNGAEVTPAVTVKVGDATLAEGTDYTVAYSNNVNAGKDAVVTVTGEGNYTGSATATFTIDAASIASATVSVTGSQTYTGSALTPAVTVKNGNTTLTQGTDYTLAFKNNTNAGTATVTVTGAGNYTGTAQGSFQIAKAVYDTSSIAFDSVSGTYNGKAYTVTVTGAPQGVTINYIVTGTEASAYLGNSAVDAGKYTVTARFAVDSNHEAIAERTATITIKKAAGKITATAAKSSFKVNKTKAQKTTIKVKGAAGSLTYKSNKAGVTVSKAGKVTIKKGFKGTAKITVKDAGNNNYKAASAAATIKVK